MATHVCMIIGMFEGGMPASTEHAMQEFVCWQYMPADFLTSLHCRDCLQHRLTRQHTHNLSTCSLVKVAVALQTSWANAAFSQGTDSRTQSHAYFMMSYSRSAKHAVLKTSWHACMHRLARVARGTCVPVHACRWLYKRSNS